MQAHVLLAFILVAVVVVVVRHVRVWFFTHPMPSLQCPFPLLLLCTAMAHSKSVSVRLIESINHKLDRIPAVYRGERLGSFGKQLGRSRSCTLTASRLNLRTLHCPEHPHLLTNSHSSLLILVAYFSVAKANCFASLSLFSTQHTLLRPCCLLAIILKCFITYTHVHTHPHVHSSLAPDPRPCPRRQ